MRKLLIGMSGAVAGALAVVAYGQGYNASPPPTDRSSYFSTADLQAIMDSIPAGEDGKPAQFSKRLYTASTFSHSFIRITSPDVPHAHGVWAETFVIVDGDAVLETGGTITGVTGSDSATHRDFFVDPAAPPPEVSPEEEERRAAQGNLAGTDIEGGTSQRVGPGDIVLIPAGVPHRWIQVDKPVVYHDIKFPKAEG